MEDLRCTVENQLQGHVGTGLLDREWWLRFLQIIGGTEQEARALLQGFGGAQISVKEFLDFLFRPKEATVPTAQKSDNTTRTINWRKPPGAPLVMRPAALKSDNTTMTNNLKEYFEKHYREGGHFCHFHYEICSVEWTWVHQPTGIQVWCDAIDLTSGDGGQVFFHYTSELAFRNITHPSKESAEIWASLRTEGPNANAWWGKGIYTVPYPPDQWQSREQLLDNNFRNMMQRDRDSEDPEKGPAFVAREYPKRAAFCVPILIDPANAFDVSARATPEMEAAGKEPGRNLGNKLLNEPGKPPRCCVVLRVSGEHGVQHARGQLLNTLRQRVRHAPANLNAKYRLATTLHLRGFYQEALPVAQEMVALSASTYGPGSAEGFGFRSTLSIILSGMGNFQEAEKMEREILNAKMKAFGPEHPHTVLSMAQLALFSNMQGREGEAVELYRKVVAFREKQLGPSHVDTLHTMTNLAISLNDMGNHQEAIELHRRALEAREKALGPEHPETLQSVSHLALALHARGDLGEALTLQRRALEARERDLGPQHPSSQKSLERIVSILLDMINKRFDVPGEIVELCCKAVTSRVNTFSPEHQHVMSCTSELALGIFNMENHKTEAVELYRQIAASQERCLGPSHIDTLHTMTNLAIILNDMGNHQEAIDLHRRALEAREKTLGPEHPVTLQSVSHLALALHGRGDLGEALTLQSRTLEARERQLGPQDPSTCRSLERLESILLEMINTRADVPGEIVELCREMLATRAKTLGPEHPETESAKAALAITLTGACKYDEAVGLLRQLVETREKTLGVDHPTTLSTVTILGVALEEMGDFSDTNLHRRVSEAREKLGAMNQPDL